MAKVTAADLADAFDKMAEEVGAVYPDDKDEYGDLAGTVMEDYRPTTAELRTVARRIADDREIRTLKVEILLAQIGSAFSDGDRMAARSAYRLGMANAHEQDTERKAIAEYLVDKDVTWDTVLTMNS